MWYSWIGLSIYNWLSFGMTISSSALIQILSIRMAICFQFSFHINLYRTTVVIRFTYICMDGLNKTYTIYPLQGWWETRTRFKFRSFEDKKSNRRHSLWCNGFRDSVMAVALSYKCRHPIYWKSWYNWKLLKVTQNLSSIILRI